MGRFIPEHLPEPVKTTIKDTASYVEKKLDAGRTDRSDMAEAIVMDQIMKPMDEIVDNWTNLTMSNSEKQAILNDRAAVIKGYVDSMAPGDMRMTLETLAKMEKYGTKFAEALMADPEKFDWVKGALKFVLGMQAEKSSSVDAGKESAENNIVKYLTGPQTLEGKPNEPKSTEPDPNFAFACTLLAFAKPQIRKGIIDKCLQDDKVKKMDFAAKQEFFKALCDNGAISPLEVDEAIGPKQFANDEEKQKWGKFLQGISTLWEQKHDFTEEARRLSTESYGAKNAANEMFTVSNILRTFGYVAGSLTVLLNWIVNFKEIKNDPSYAFRIPQVLFGAAEVAVAAYSDSDSSLGEMVASKETLTNWNEKKAHDGLLSVVSASPRGWKTLLEDNDSFGVRILADFVSKKCLDNKDLKETEATVANFETYIKELQAADPSNSKHYDELLTQLKDITGRENNTDITGTRFKKLANAFVKLNILGANDQVAGIYKAALTKAQGAEPPPTTATQAPAVAPTTKPATT